MMQAVVKRHWKRQGQDRILEILERDGGRRSGCRARLRNLSQSKRSTAFAKVFLKWPSAVIVILPRLKAIGSIIEKNLAR